MTYGGRLRANVHRNPISGSSDFVTFDYIHYTYQLYICISVFFCIKFFFISYIKKCTPMSRNVFSLCTSFGYFELADNRVA